MAVQLLKLRTSTVGGTGLIPGGELLSCMPCGEAKKNQTYGDSKRISGCQGSREDGEDFPDGTVDQNLPASAGDTGWIPGPGRLHMLRE